MIPALFLVLLAVVYRIATAIIVQGGGSAWLSNFAPLAAIALCSAIYFPRKYKFTVPFAALLVSDIILDIYYGASLFDPLIACRYFAFALVGLLGLAIRRRASLRTIVPASLAGSALWRDRRRSRMALRAVVARNRHGSCRRQSLSDHDARCDQGHARAGSG